MLAIYSDWCVMVPIVVGVVDVDDGGSVELPHVCVWLLWSYHTLVCNGINQTCSCERLCLCACVFSLYKHVTNDFYATADGGSKDYSHIHMYTNELKYNDCWCIWCAYASKRDKSTLAHYAISTN